MVRARALCVAAGLATLAACKPNLNETVSIVETSRVLGVQASPAEAAAKAQVSFTSLVADPSGTVSDPAVQWNFCNARNPLANLGPVAPACEQPGNDQLQLLGVGPSASGSIPDVACRNFGPDAPQPMMGQPQGRPVDPDPTGGYYQPVSLFLPSDTGEILSQYQMRISCGFVGADQQSVAILAARYHFNVNPVIAGLTLDGAPLMSDQNGAQNTMPAGAKHTLEVSWPVCPITDVCGDGFCGPDETAMTCPADCMTPKGCGGAERYVSFDLASRSVVDQREGIHVSWFATAGTFDNDRTGIDSADTVDTASDNGWQPPAQPGSVHLWVVLHDDRGGVGWAGYALNVQ